MMPNIRAVLGPLALVVVTTIAFLEANPAADQASAAPATGSAAATGKAMTAAEWHGRAIGRDYCLVRDRRASPQCDVVRSVVGGTRNGIAAHCRVNGSIAPVDTHGTARPINFSVVLPATWSGRAAQLGGGGMNGFVPNLTGGGPGAGTVSPRSRLRDIRERLRTSRRLVDRAAALEAGTAGRNSPTIGRSTTRRSEISATCR